MSIASDWLKQISLAARPIRSTTQIWAVTRHQFEISPFVPQTSSLRGVHQFWRREMSAVFLRLRKNLSHRIRRLVIFDIADFL